MLTWVSSDQDGLLLTNLIISWDNKEVIRTSLHFDNRYSMGRDSKVIDFGNAPESDGHS